MVVGVAGVQMTRNTIEQNYKLRWWGNKRGKTFNYFLYDFLRPLVGFILVLIYSQAKPDFAGFFFSISRILKCGPSSGRVVAGPLVMLITWRIIVMTSIKAAIKYNKKENIFFLSLFTFTMQHF